METPAGNNISELNFICGSYSRKLLLSFHSWHPLCVTYIGLDSSSSYQRDTFGVRPRCSIEWKLRFLHSKRSFNTLSIRWQRKVGGCTNQIE